jgi:hypothetical protein
VKIWVVGFSKVGFGVGLLKGCWVHELQGSLSFFWVAGHEMRLINVSLNLVFLLSVL